MAASTDITGALIASSRGNAAPEAVLRAVAAHAKWHLPLDERGEPMVFAVAGEATELLIAEVAPPAGPHRQVTGRELPDQIDDLDGIVLDPGLPHAVVLRGEALDGLRRMARAEALAAAVAAPGPGQGSLIRGGPWWVLLGADGAPATARKRLLPVFTGPDRAAAAMRVEPGWFQVAELDGSALWRGLAAREDFDGVAFDLHSAAESVHGPHLARGLAQGADPRPGADPLPARTIAEVHRWLDEAGAGPDRPHAVVRREGEAELVSLYAVQIDHVPRKIAFALVEPTPDPEDLGAGPSRILCAGQLLLDARTDLSGLPAAGRDEAQRRRARRAARLLDQLREMLEGDRIPFHALRTARGAAHWRQEPELYTAGWIEAQASAAARG
jgi:hypothetical protein